VRARIQVLCATTWQWETCLAAQLTECWSAGRLGNYFCVGSVSAAYRRVQRHAEGSVSGCARSIACRVGDTNAFPGDTCTTARVLWTSNASVAALRVRTRDALSESRVRDGLNNGTLKPHVRFDERGPETEPWLEPGMEPVSDTVFAS